MKLNKEVTCEGHPFPLSHDFCLAAWIWRLTAKTFPQLDSTFSLLALAFRVFVDLIIFLFVEKSAIN
jgi:hypothetical protein